MYTRTHITRRVSEPSCFEAAPAQGIFFLEPAPAPVNIRTVNELSKITCNTYNWIWGRSRLQPNTRLSAAPAPKPENFSTYNLAGEFIQILISLIENLKLAVASNSAKWGFSSFPLNEKFVDLAILAD